MSLLRQKEGLAEDRSRDEKTQLIVGCIGSAADIIEFVSETVGDVPDQLCNGNLLQNFTLLNLSLIKRLSRIICPVISRSCNVLGF